MQYLLMIHSDEKAISRRQRTLWGTCPPPTAPYHRHETGGRPYRRRAPAAELDGDRGAREQRQDFGTERPLRRNQGTAWRLLPHRGARSRRGDRMGGRLPRRAIRPSSAAASGRWKSMLARRNVRPDNCRLWPAGRWLSLVGSLASQQTALNREFAAKRMSHAPETGATELG